MPGVPQKSITLSPSPPNQGLPEDLTPYTGNVLHPKSHNLGFRVLGLGTWNPNYLQLYGLSLQIRCNYHMLPPEVVGVAGTHQGMHGHVPGGDTRGQVESQPVGFVPKGLGV